MNVRYTHFGISIVYSRTIKSILNCNFLSMMHARWKRLRWINVNSMLGLLLYRTGMNSFVLKKLAAAQEVANRWDLWKEIGGEGVRNCG